MLRGSDARVRHRSVRLAELLQWDADELRPECIRALEIEPLVQVEVQTQTGLIDVEEVPQPSDEERDHPSIAVGELDAPVGLGALAGVQRNPRHEELPL